MHVINFKNSDQLNNWVHAGRHGKLTLSYIYVIFKEQTGNTI